MKFIAWIISSITKWIQLIKLNFKVIFPLITLIIFSILVGLYCYSFWGQLPTATTADYANFGTYVNGITLPFSIIATTITIGYQIRKSSEISKSERLQREYNDLLIRTATLINQIDQNYITNIENKARHAYKTGVNVLLADESGDFYERNSQMIASVGLISLMLQQIIEIDMLQFKSSRITIFTLTNRDAFSKLERILFYLDNYRYSANSDSYFWICSESKFLAKK